MRCLGRSMCPSHAYFSCCVRPFGAPLFETVLKWGDPSGWEDVPIGTWIPSLGKRSDAVTLSLVGEIMIGVV